MVSPANDRESGGELLTTVEAARLLGVSPVTLSEWRQERGRGPAHLRLGYRTVRYERAAVERFKRQRRRS